MFDVDGIEQIKKEDTKASVWFCMGMGGLRRGGRRRPVAFASAGGFIKQQQRNKKEKEWKRRFTSQQCVLCCRRRRLHSTRPLWTYKARPNAGVPRSLCYSLSSCAPSSVRPVSLSQCSHSHSLTHTHIGRHVQLMCRPVNRPPQNQCT